MTEFTVRTITAQLTVSVETLPMEPKYAVGDRVMTSLNQMGTITCVYVIRNKMFEGMVEPTEYIVYRVAEDEEPHYEITLDSYRNNPYADRALRKTCVYGTEPLATKVEP